MAISVVAFSFHLILPCYCPGLVKYGLFSFREKHAGKGAEKAFEIINWYKFKAGHLCFQDRKWCLDSGLLY